MGAISFTLDPQLMSELRRQLLLEIFVETGTFRGDTMELARHEFPECHSAELSAEYYEAALLRFAGAANVHLFQGDSPTLLRSQQPRFASRPTFFWLDAHWCAAESTAGEQSQCPLLDELSAIGSIHPQSVVLIDDARYFLGPPPAPHEISGWPDWESVSAALRRLSTSHVIVCSNDVIHFLPASIQTPVRNYLHRTVIDIVTLADKARDYDILLAQDKEKDLEINRLKEECIGKDKEISSLKKIADEREKAVFIHHGWLQDAGKQLAECTANSAQEIAKLRQENLAQKSTIVSLKQESALRDEKIQKLQGSGFGQGSIGSAHRLSVNKGYFARLARVGALKLQAHLESQMPYRLGKLSQYAPRQMTLEQFPRRSYPKNWPRICLITPSFQQGAFLERTMRSVLDQNYPALSYGVQDGGSTDGSAEIIVRHLPRLAHAESSPDHGQADAIRKGFAKLYPQRDDIMGWLNSDDLSMPGALSYVGAYFASNPEVDVIYGHRVVVDAQDLEIGRWYLPRYHANTLPWFDLVPQETFFWRSKCYDMVGGVDANLQFALDWDLLLKFAAAGCQIKRVPYFLGCFRHHPEQKTSAHIHTIGEEEMQLLRMRTHGGMVPRWRILDELAEEERRSTSIAWLATMGIRW